MKKSKKKKKSNTWKIKQHRDQFFKKSKTLGYRSRSAFKLIELNKKYKFVKKNTKLLDVGSGTGYTVKLLKDNELDVTGLDKSGSMVSKAKEK